MEKTPRERAIELFVEDSLGMADYKSFEHIAEEEQEYWMEQAKTYGV